MSHDPFDDSSCVPALKAVSSLYNRDHEKVTVGKSIGRKRWTTMGHGPVRMRLLTKSVQRRKEIKINRTDTHTHTICFMAITTLWPCNINSCRKYLDYWPSQRPTPQDEDEERSSREKKENRQRVTLRVAWWWFPVVVDEFCNGTVRVGIVHSIACSARFPSSLISDKQGLLLGQTSRRVVWHSLVSSLSTMPSSSIILHRHLCMDRNVVTSRH